MVSRMLTPEHAHKFPKNFSNDTDVTQQKFISQLASQDETCIHNFDSESEQQSMQYMYGTNQSVKIVISLHCVTPFSPFRLQITDDR